jgi:WD40 repeat protein
MPVEFERGTRMTPSGPYPGVRPFTRDEAAIFFGRDEQVDGLLARLQTSRLVAVAGESGCGKSSLVRAGLLPALDAGFLLDARSRWRIADLRPGNHPMQNLAAALSMALDVGDVQDMLAARLRRGPLGIVEILEDHPLPEDTEVLILVDQFEELFRFRSQLDPNEADAFVALLLETMQHDRLAVRIVLTLRTDYLGECAYFRGLPEVLNGCQYLVPRLEREQLLEIIVAPARVFDGDVDSVLANHIVNEIGRSQDQLPVIEHALFWMWSRADTHATAQLEHRAADPHDASRVLAMADYDALGGGLGEALSKHADEIYGALSADQKPIAQALFCALWDEHAEESDTRRPCTVSEAAQIAGVTEDQLREVVEHFRKPEHSLLFPPPDVALDGDRMLDVGHESLFRHWHRLKEWTRREADSAEQYRRWGSLAVAWRNERSDLLSDRNLEAAEEWRTAARPNAAWARRYSRGPDEFAILEKFLTESRATQSERQQERRRVRAGILMLGVIAFVAIIVVVVLFVKDQAAALHAREVEQSASRQRLSAAALNAVPSEPVRGMQLASAAYRPDGTEAEIALRKSIRDSHFRDLVIASGGTFVDAKFLPDGHRIVTLGDADGLAIWDIASGRRLLSLRTGARQDVLAVASSGAVAATGGDDGEVDLWDLNAAKHLATLDGHLAKLSALAFSPDDRRLASAGDDGVAIVWDVATGTRRQEMVWHMGSVNGVAFSPDGARLATSGDDGRILLWDVASGRKLRQIEQGDSLGALAFNATGRFLAVHDDASVVLWDPITERKDGTLSHTNRVSALAFSPDGMRIATASFDGTLRIWDPVRRVELSRISEEPALQGTNAAPPNAAPDRLGASMRHWFHTLAFSADGRQLVTTTLDGTAKVWNVDHGGEIMAFKAHETGIHRVAYNAAGTRLATAGDDGTVAVWDVQGQLVFRSQRSGPAQGAALNDEGTRVVFSDQSRIVYWDIAQNRQLAQFSAPGRIRDVRLFRHGDRVAATAGQQVFVWHLDGKRPVLVLEAKLTIVALAVSADDKWIASECTEQDEATTGRHLCLWDASSGERIAMFHSSRRGTESEGSAAHTTDDALQLQALDLDFSSDGKWLVSASKDKSAKIWDVHDRQLVATFAGHRESVEGVAFSPDGKTIASSGTDWVRLWSTDSKGPRDGFPDVEHGSESVAFSSDGRLLVAGGDDGVVRAFALDPAVLVRLSGERAGFGLDERTRNRYSIGEAPSTRQSINDARKRLYDGSTAVEGVLAAGEAARFDAARTIERADDKLGDVIGRAVVSAMQANHGSSPEQLAKALLEATKRAAADAKASCVTLLRDAQRIDPGLAFDAAQVATRAIDARIIRHARIAAGARAVIPAAVLLESTSRPSSDVARRAIDMVETIGFDKATQAMHDRDLAHAIEILTTIEPPSTDRRYVLWLWLKARMCYLRSKTTQSLSEARDMAQLASKLAQTAIGLTNDPDAITDLASMLVDPPAVAATAQKALRLDAANDGALFMLGISQAVSQPGEALATLRKVSPLFASYKEAVGVAGSVAYDRLHRLDEGYHLMAVAAEGRDASVWANLAEAAWATGRFQEASLAARRVLDARDVDPAESHVNLAMRFVLVASLAHTGDLATARRELDELLRFMSAVAVQGWSYSGSRAAINRLASSAERSFVTALIDHVESLGKKGDPAQLHALLQELR